MGAEERERGSPAALFLVEEWIELLPTPPPVSIFLIKFHVRSFPN